MIDLQPGTRVFASEWVLREPVVQDEWGELWRADHPAKGPAFVVLYSTEAGDALFNESLPALKQWQKIADSGLCPHLLRIYAIMEASAIPCIIVEDTGGRLLRQLVAAQHPNVVDAVGIMVHVSRGLVGVKTYEIGFAGLTPDTIVEAPGNTDAPWRLLPVCPGARRAAAHVWNGRYNPPELAGGEKLDELNADVFGLSWILAELVTGNDALERNPAIISQYLPWQRLRIVLGNGFKPMAGKYADPKLTAIALERWIKTDATADLGDIRAREDAAKRSKFASWLHQNRKIISQIAGLLIGFALITLLIWLVPKMFSSPTTTREPYGLSELFFDALVERDVATAKSMARGSAVGQVDLILRDIKAMENDHLASRFSAAAPAMPQGSGATRNVKVDLYGENGDLFMKAEMTIREDDAGEWYVDTLFFEPLRRKGE